MKVFTIVQFACFYFCAFFTNAYSQNENNFWYFGDGAALNFSTPNPTFVNGSAMNALEGSASISDKFTGQLLFYTNGVRVWNKNNIQMPNGWGLYGSFSASQSAIIFPTLSIANQYYLFTVSETPFINSPSGLSYSIVDMTLQGGLGDVSATKNIHLLDSTCEKVTAIKHCNGKDIWLITHKFNSDAFYAYLITNAGIQQPVVTHIGSINNCYQGYLKASPNGKIASAIGTNPCNIIEIFDFDVSTGVLSNPIIDILTGSYPYPYGVAFSSDNSKVYFSVSDNIYQYNLNAGSPAAILASRYLVVNHPLGFFGMGLAKNGKIYISKYGQNNLDIINLPNLNLGGCAYQSNGFQLDSGVCNFGVPNFLDSYLYNLGNNLTVCSDSYTIDAGSGWAKYLWSNNATTQTIEVSQSGNYWVDLVSADSCIKRAIVDLEFVELPEFKLPADTSFCGTSLTLKANSPSDKYLWNTGDTTESISITKSGSYSVRLTKGVCVVSDTIKIEVLTKAPQFAPPNIFTPNGDNTNDTYNIGAANFNEYTFKIFNRWGQLVFETTDTKVNWDGKSKGKDVPAGSYYWILSGNTVCGNDKTVIEEKGFVTLVR